MGRGAGIGTWRPIDYLLVAACVLGGTATILVGVYTHVLEIAPWNKYEGRPARVTGVTSAMTRCDDCVHPFLDDDSSSEDGQNREHHNRNDNIVPSQGRHRRAALDEGHSSDDSDTLESHQQYGRGPGEGTGRHMGGYRGWVGPGSMMGPGGEPRRGSMMGAGSGPWRGSMMGPGSGPWKEQPGDMMGSEDMGSEQRDSEDMMESEHMGSEHMMKSEDMGSEDMGSEDMGSEQRDSEHMMGPGNGPMMGPGNGPMMGPENGPMMGPENGPMMGPENGPMMGPENGPMMGLENGPMMGPENGPMMGPENGPMMGSYNMMGSEYMMGPEYMMGTDGMMCDLIMPNWWMARVPDKQTRQTVEKECPLVPALYVTVTYTDDDGRPITALLHEDVYSETFPTYSYSMCDQSKGGLKGQWKVRTRRQIPGYDPKLTPPGKTTIPPVFVTASATMSAGMKTFMGMAEHFRKLYGSGQEFLVYVNAENPQHVIGMTPRYSLWVCRRFMPLIAFTFVMFLILLIRRILVHKNVQRRNDAQTPVVCTPNGPVVFVDQPNKTELTVANPEKDPTALGPEVVFNPNYDVIILGEKSVVLNGRAGDVTTPEKETEAFQPNTPDSQEQDTPPPVGDEGVRPPVYTNEEDPENRPPTYSSIDMSKC